MEERSKLLVAEIGELEKELLSLYDACDIETFEHGGHKATIVEDKSVRMPTGDARERLYSYMKDRGAFESLISVQYQTLNGWWKEEVKLREAKGVADPVPGLEDHTSWFRLRITKTKGAKQ